MNLILLLQHVKTIQRKVNFFIIWVWNYLPFLNEKLNKYQDKPDVFFILIKIANINFNNFLILTQKLNDEIFLGNEPNFASIIEIFRFLNNVLDIKISFLIELSASQFILIVKLLKLIIFKASLGIFSNYRKRILRKRLKFPPNIKIFEKPILNFEKSTNSWGISSTSCRNMRL